MAEKFCTTSHSHFGRKKFFLDQTGNKLADQLIERGAVDSLQLADGVTEK